MKKILTAIGNSNINNKIKKIEKYEVLSEDITNDNELLNFLESEEQVDVLFLCKSIICNYKPVDFINLIREINKNIFIIFFDEDKNEDIKPDSNLKICHELNVNLKELEKDLDNRKTTEIKDYTSKIIAISGVNGIGKSMFSTLLAQNVENQSKKTLLIDFDLDENYIKTILKIKKTPEGVNELKSMITEVNKYLDVLCNLNLFFPYTDDVNFFTIQKMLNSFRNEYNLIIIDTSSSINKEYTRKIFYNSDKIIFLIEPNILGIKKAKNMLEVIETDWKISSEKINIVLNKSDNYDISQSIVEELFSDIKVIGKMKYSNYYNLMINQNVNKKEIGDEYVKIWKKIK